MNKDVLHEGTFTEPLIRRPTSYLKRLKLAGSGCAWLAGGRPRVAASSAPRRADARELQRGRLAAVRLGGRELRAAPAAIAPGPCGSAHPENA